MRSMRSIAVAKAVIDSACKSIEIDAVTPGSVARALTPTIDVDDSDKAAMMSRMRSSRSLQITRKLVKKPGRSSRPWGNNESCSSA